jgi:hypothetical protein
MATRFNTKDAVSAVRGEFRSQGIDPEKETDKQAWAMLDNMARQDRSLLVSQWYTNSTPTEQSAFTREWNRWQKEMSRLKSLPMTPARAVQDAVSHLRHNGLKPEQITWRNITDDALSGDMAVRQEAAAVWFATVSRTQVSQMKKEYERWHRTYETI